MQPIQIADLLDYVSFHAIQARRTFLSRLLFANFGGVVRYGPLKGFKLDEDPSWNPADLAPKLLGLYEQEVLNLIAGLRGRHRVIVNLGAGDGYYGIGLVSTGMFEQSICFELTESGQETLKRTAAKNGVQHKVKVLGAAGPDFAKAIVDLGLKPSDCLIVCDIEGAEFSIFTPDCLASLRGAHIIVELHGCFMPNGAALEQTLIANGSQWFNTSLARTSMRDLSGIPELEMMNDSDRWLICSESRPKLMSWLLLAPKA